MGRYDNWTADDFERDNRKTELVGTYMVYSLATWFMAFLTFGDVYGWEYAGLAAVVIFVADIAVRRWINWSVDREMESREHESNEDDDLCAKTAKNEIVLVCDDLDYAAIQNAIARRQSSRIMPDNGSNVAGAVIAEICRGWEEMLSHRPEG